MGKDTEVFKRLLSREVEKKLKPDLVTTLRSVAEYMIDVIDGGFQPVAYKGDGGNNQYPIWYGQLHDSTGVGVYIDGALRDYRPTNIGWRKQHTEDESGIVGSEKLDEALAAATTMFPTGIWIVLFSAVPYAMEINEEGSKWGRGRNFFDTLADTLKSQVFASLKPLTV